MDKRIENLTEIISSYKKGNKIHIKKANRGKFTDYCGGKVTSECIARGKASPNPAIRKRATFAANARKWKHAEGGVIDEDQTFSGIKTTNNRPYNSAYITYINNKLRDAGMSKEKRTAILSNIIEESGGEPFAEGPGGFYGLLQWSPERYKQQSSNKLEELDNQINYIIATEGNKDDKKSWTHGGTGSGYMSLVDAIKDFNSTDFRKAMKGYTLGHVRPANALKVLEDRMKIAEQLYNIKGFYAKGGNLIYDPFIGKQSNKKDKTNKLSLVYTSQEPEKTPEAIEIENEIYKDYKPSFPVVPVNVPSIQKQTEQTTQEEQIQQSQTIETPTIDVATSTPKQEVADATKVKGIVEYKTSGMNIGNMQELIDLMRDEGISFRVTSGLRSGAKTKSGKKSHHSEGNAIDIVPIKGQTFNDIVEQIRKSEKVKEYMRNHGIGILDETTKEMLAKTGGTGAHFHFGPDVLAINNFKKLFG